MKRYIILLFALSIFAMEHPQAQKKIGVFVHGFQGGSEKWTEQSGVPGAWKSEGIIDDFVALDYETMDLATNQSQSALVSRFVSNMRQKGSPVNDQWILVGHSLGGILSRALYPAFKQAGFNVVAVISVGGPSQGAAATDVDKTFIDNRLQLMEDRIEEAYKYRNSFIDFAVSFLDLVNGTNNRDRIDAIPNYIATARDSALGYADLVIENEASKLIGLDGSLIREINSYPQSNNSLHPQNYLSIIGAEKDKAPIRMAGQIFTEEKELKDEAEMINNLQRLRDDYFFRHEKKYDRLFNRYYAIHTACRILHPFRRSICSQEYDNFIFARYRRDVWKAARREIDNLGQTWSQIINSYKFVHESIRVWEPGCDSGNMGFDQPDYFFRIEPCDGTEGRWVYKIVTSTVPDKHDGVVNIHSALWSKNDSFDDQNNIYMKDVNITPRGDDGGYNHFELRNYARAYTLKEDGQVVFSEGDKNPAMERAEDWIGREL